MQWQAEYVVQIQTKEGWSSWRIQSADIVASVQKMLKEHGIRFKNQTMLESQGHRCPFYFWDQGPDKYGLPKTIAQANEIFP